MTGSTNWDGLLPGFVVVGSAIESEIAKVRLLCAGLKAGEIALFDKGYHQLAHFAELTQRGVFFVTRPKDDLLVRVVRRRSRKGVNERVLADEEIVLCSRQGRADHPERLRRVRARVVVDGQEREIVFVTNNFEPGFRDWKCIVPSEDRIRQVVG